MMHESVRRDWSPHEVQATVASYMTMLRSELEGSPYVKTRFNAELRTQLDDRTKGAVERKYQNVSAVLLEMGLRYIDGYKPLGNRQELLADAVNRYLAADPTLARTLGQEGPSAADPLVVAGEIVVMPPTLLPRGETTKGDRRARKVDHATVDAANRDLGKRGEQWVRDQEVRRLRDAGYPRLAEQVRWVADDEGDGHGYDIESRNEDGTRRFIEVKTTNGGIRTPFIVTANELEVSQELGEAYHLFRVFGFETDPHFFVLTGDITSCAHLEPTHFRAGWSAPAPS